MLTCQYGEACPRYLSPLLSAPLLSSKGRGRGRSKVGWCPGVNCFATFFSRFMRSWRCKSIYTQKKKQTISPCIDLLLPFPWHCRRYQGWGNCPDSWAFSVSAGPGESGSSLLSPIITKVMLLMIIFLMLFMIIMVMFMIAISHMMARLMMV